LEAFEFKYLDAPKITKSMQIALQDLKIKHINVIYPGEKAYQLSKNIFVIGLADYLSRK